MVFQLESRSSVERIQFLVHNTMIPSSIEVYIGDVGGAGGSGAAGGGSGGDGGEAPPDLKRAQFLFLGEVQLNNNKKTHFKGRQLQTVEIGTSPHNKCTFVKLMLRQNHINRHNEYNQVSLLGVNIVGTPVEDEEDASGSGSGEDERSEKRRGKTLSHRDDLSFLMYTDSDIVKVEMHCRVFCPLLARSQSFLQSAQKRH